MLNVKSTMVDELLNLIAPHYCCSCGEIGAILCESCKYDIISEPLSGCLLCYKSLLVDRCTHCRSDIDRMWCGGERLGALEHLIDLYKFEYAQAAYKPLGDILLATLPQLPPETIIIPIPTIRSHIRQRGYDHALLLAQHVARSRQLTCKQLVQRKTASVQRDATRKQRIEQAKQAFSVKDQLQPDTPYLLIDDVATTGSTLKYAAKTLKDAGATIVWAAAVARQPLD